MSLVTSLHGTPVQGRILDRVEGATGFNFSLWGTLYIELPEFIRGTKKKTGTLLTPSFVSL
jgi:hypothetical protein